MKKYLAELIGTYGLVFCGTGAVVINDVSGGAVTHVGIAITFGLIVMAMIYTFGHISGAHINPAVTLSFWVLKKQKTAELIPFVLAQLGGAFLASATLLVMFPSHETFGATLPAGTWLQSFVLEIVLSYFLMLVILFVSQNEPISKLTGIVVGGTVLLEALFAGPISGASMNPARSLAPAIISGKFSYWWVYIVAPILGMLLASFTWREMEKSQ